MDKVATPEYSEARRILTASSSCALAALKATKVFLGDFYAWEPESIWLELERQGIDVAESVQVKIQVALALWFSPSFYWDGIVMEKTALGFDGIIPNPETLEEASTAQLAWAVIEAARIVQFHEDEPHTFQHEPAAYAAVVMHREGFLVAPHQLTFAQELLDAMNVGQKDLRDSVKEDWAKVDNHDLHDVQFSESSRDVQFARLSAVELHVRDMQRRLDADLTSLTY